MDPGGSSEGQSAPASVPTAGGLLAVLGGPGLVAASIPSAPPSHRCPLRVPHPLLFSSKDTCFGFRAHPNPGRSHFQTLNLITLLPNKVIVTGSGWISLGGSSGGWGHHSIFDTGLSRGRNIINIPRIDVLANLIFNERMSLLDDFSSLSGNLK